MIGFVLILNLVHDFFIVLYVSHIMLFFWIIDFKYLLWKLLVVMLNVLTSN